MSVTIKFSSRRQWDHVVDSLQAAITQLGVNCILVADKLELSITNITTDILEQIELQCLLFNVSLPK